QVPTQAPSLGASVLAAGGGAALGSFAGPGGTVAGGAAGAGMASYLLNAAQTFEELTEKGVDEQEALEYTRLAGVPQALLDMALPGYLALRVLRARAMGAAARQSERAARGLARRVGVEAGKGVATESVTEAGQ